MSASFVDVLNDSTVTYVNLDAYWHPGEAPVEGWGYEAISPTGEVRPFATYAEAHAWRMAEVRASADY